MPRRGKRIRVATNIYADGSGLAARVAVGEWRKEKRFRLDTPIDVIQAWQDRERERLSYCGRAMKPERGTLAADVDRYLDQVRHLAGWVSLRSELRAWVALFPQTNRYRLTAAEVRQARSTWLDAGLQPKTINNRVAALARLFHQLDGRRAPTPCDDVTPLRVHKTPARVITNAIVTAVYDRLLEFEQSGRLRTAKARARFMVIASTGKRPSELMRAQPDDVDLGRRVWIVRDGKGGFSPGVYLNDEMLVAWMIFAQADAWGPFREGSWVRTLRAAGWPAGVRPYQLRHTIGLRMSEGGADLADIQQHLGHKRIETTRRHYVPVLGSRLQRVSELLDGRFGWTGDGATPGAPAAKREAESGGELRTPEKRAPSPDQRKPRRTSG